MTPALCFIGLRSGHAEGAVPAMLRIVAGMLASHTCSIILTQSAALVTLARCMLIDAVVKFNVVPVHIRSLGVAPA